jgi:hypothetical protein
MGALDRAKKCPWRCVSSACWPHGQLLHVRAFPYDEEKAHSWAGSAPSADAWRVTRRRRAGGRHNDAAVASWAVSRLFIHLEGARHVSLVVAWLLVVVSLGVLGFAGVGTARGDEQSAEHRVFELRTYITNEGKMPELHKRFREHTNRLFEKHGMTLVGYWTPVDGDDAANTLVYVLAFPSVEARGNAWKDFISDPEWRPCTRPHENGR